MHGDSMEFSYDPGHRNKDGYVLALSKCDIREAVNGWLIGIEEKEKERLSLIHALYAR